VRIKLKQDILLCYVLSHGLGTFKLKTEIKSTGFNPPLNFFVEIKFLLEAF